MKKLILFSGLISLMLFACKKDPVTTDGPYFPKVRTIMQNSCVSCHQPNGVGLPTLLVTDDDIASNAASIKASVIDPITVTNKRMPQGSDLSQSDKDIIQKWFDKGGRKTD